MIPLGGVVVNFSDRVLGAPVRAEPVRARLETGLEEGFEHQLQGCLHDPVSHGRDAQPTELAVRLRDHHLPHRDRLERPALQLGTDVAQKHLNPDPGLDPGHRGPVDPGCSRPGVGSDAFPRHRQERRVVNQVEQIIKPATGIPGRPTVQLGLHPSYRQKGPSIAGPVPGAGIHRRISDHHSPSLSDTLPPFPMWPALLASEYYGGSAPPTAFSRQRTYPPKDRPRVVPVFTVVRSTGEVSGFAPAVSSWLRRRPSPRPAGPSTSHRSDSSPPAPAAWRAAETGRYAPLSSPYPPGSSWSTIKRRYNTGSLRIPSRLAHQTRPIRQCWTVLTSSRLLPPSPAFPGSGCRQLHPTATTARRRRSLTSIRNNSASRRTMCSSTPRVFTPASRSFFPTRAFASTSIASQQVCQSTPRWRASADTVVSSWLSAAVAQATDRVVSTARAGARSCSSLNVAVVHIGSRHRQIRFSQRTSVTRPKQGASCSR